MALFLRGSVVLAAARPASMATAGAVGSCAAAQRRGFASGADLLAAATLKSGDVVLQNAGHGRIGRSSLQHDGVPNSKAIRGSTQVRARRILLVEQEDVKAESWG